MSVAPARAACDTLLENIGSEEARRVLESLAAGTLQARSTAEAKASLSRLRSGNSMVKAKAYSTLASSPKKSLFGAAVDVTECVASFIFLSGP